MESQLAAAPAEENFDLLNEETFGGEEPWDFENGGDMPDFFVGDENDANLAELDVTPQKSQTLLRGDIEASLGRLVDDYDTDALIGKPIPNSRTTNPDDLFGPSSSPGFVDPETIVTPSIWSSPPPTSSLLENFGRSNASINPLLDSIRHPRPDPNVLMHQESRPMAMPALPGRAQTLEEIEQSMFSQSPAAEARSSTPDETRAGSLPDDPAILNQDLARLAMMHHLQRFRGANPPQAPMMSSSDAFNIPGLPRPLLSDVARLPHMQNGPATMLPGSPHSRIVESPHSKMPDGLHSRMPDSPHTRHPGMPRMMNSPGRIDRVGGMSPMRMSRMMQPQPNGGPGGMMLRTPPGWQHHRMPRGPGPYTDPSHAHGHWNHRNAQPGHPAWGRHSNQREDQPRRRQLDEESNSDPYAGLMSARDKEYIVKIQLLQLHSDRPHIDDYYFLKLMEKKKSSNGANRKKKSRFDNFVFEDRTYTPRQFTGALGKVTASSISHPRHLIDLPKSTQHDEGNETQQSERRKFRQLLGNIEKGYSLFLRLEDVLWKANQPPQAGDTEPEADEQTLRMQLGETLLQLDIRSMLSVRKGRILLLRGLTGVVKEQACTLVSRIIRNSAEISEKHSSPEFAEALGDEVTSALDLSVDEMLSLIRSLEPPHIQHALQNQLGATVVCTLILRGHQLLAAPGPHTSNWCSLLMAVADQLCGEATLASVCGDISFEELLACFTCVPAAIESPSFSRRLEKLCTGS